MTHYTFTATDGSNRPGTVHVDPEHMIQGHCGWFTLDQDPGSGSMSGTRALTTLTITGGPSEGLVKLAAWGRTYCPWMPQHQAWAESVAALV